MTNSKQLKTTPARKAMIRAFNLALAGNINLAKKELNKADRLLTKQYEKC
jgi:hypothetical protein